MRQFQLRFARTVALAALLAAGISAQVPALMQYQGRLLDNLGAPVPDGNYEISLRFYDGCVGGTLLLTDTHPAVATRDGIYSLVLGGGTVTAAIESDLRAVFAGYDVVCMGVTIGAEPEMTPRQRVLSAGYALRAGVADSATSAVTQGDNVSWSGAHTFEQSTNWANGKGLFWPHSTGVVPPDAKFRIFKFTGNPPGQQLHPNGEADEQLMFCYNCDGVNTSRDDLNQHAFNFKFEESYFDGTQEFQEHNWNFENVDGFRWRPFGFRLRITGFCSIGGEVCYIDADCGGGETCNSRDEADFTWTAKRLGHCRDDQKVICSEDADCPTGTCREDHEFRLRMDGRVESKKGMDIETWTANDLNPNNGENGLKVVVQAAPTNTDGLVRGIQALSNYHEDSADFSGMNSLIGIDAQVDFSGSASSRTIAADFTSVLAIARIDAIGGSGNSITRMSGFRSKNFFNGDSGTTIQSAAGVRIAAPDILGTVDIQDHAGLVIENQSAVGTGINAAVLVEAQGGVGSDGDTGNIRMAGGGALDGHLDLNGGHLWMDSSADTLRYKQGVPTGNADGTPVHNPAGTSPDWGGTYWGNSGSGAHDSGDEVCALANLTCLETYDMGSSTADNCSTATHGTSRFMVLCY